MCVCVSDSWWWVRIFACPGQTVLWQWVASLGDLHSESAMAEVSHRWHHRLAECWLFCTVHIRPTRSASNKFFINVVNNTVFINSLERISDTIWANGTFLQFMFVSHYFGSLNHQTECTSVILDKVVTNDLLLCCSGLSLSLYFYHCFSIFHLFSNLARTSC